MKTFELFKRLFLPAAVALVTLLGSCTKDDAEQVSISVAPETLTVTKLGLDYKGQTPSFEVVSNAYWTVELVPTPVFENGEEEWVTVSPKGGSGTTAVTLKTLPNTINETRKAVLTFTTRRGVTKTVTLVQKPDTEEVIFYTDNFGSSPANMTPVHDYNSWNYSGLGVEIPKWNPFDYSGTAYVNGTNPSSGYPGASGGNNVVLSGAGSQFVLNNIKPLEELNFQLSFGSATSGDSFDTSEFVVELSSDGSYWVRVPYERNSSSDWVYSSVDFTLKESYRYLHIRFSTPTGDPSYRIDDISVKDSSGGQVFDLVKPTPPPFVGAEFPVKWIMSSETQTGPWAQTFKLTEDGYPYILSNQAGNADPKLLGPSSLSWVYGVNLPSGYEYPTGTSPHAFTLTGGGDPNINYPWLDDYWLFSVPVQSLDAGMIVSVEFAGRISDAGHKYFMLEYMDGGEWKPASTVYQVPEDGTYSYTHIMVGSKYTVVSEKFILSNAITEDNLQVRFRCSSVYRANNATPLTSPNGSTIRLGYVDDVQPTIDVIDPNDEPAEVTFTFTNVDSRNNILLPGTANNYKFTVKADWDWTMSTSDLGWATVSPAKGDIGKTVTVTINAEENTTGDGRYGVITFTSGSTTKDVTVYQSAVGDGPTELQGLPAVWTFNFSSSTTILPDRTLKSDNDKATLQAVILPTNTGVGTTTIQYQTDNHRILTTGMLLGDYWQISVPVKNFEMGTINLKTEISISSTAPRFYAIDYSTDGATWNKVNTRKEIAWGQHGTYNKTYSEVVEYTYSSIYEGTNNIPLTINQNIDIPVDIPNGTIYIRMRVAGNLSGRGDMNASGGTNRIRGGITVSYGADPAGAGYGVDSRTPLAALDGGWLYYENFNWLNYGADYMASATNTSEQNYTGWTAAEKNKPWKVVYKDYYEWTATVSGGGWTPHPSAAFLYGKPGYVKFGKSNVGGSLMTPPLSDLSGSRNVEVKFYASAYRSNGGNEDLNTIGIRVEGPGTVTPDNIIVTNFNSFSPYTVAVNGATSDTRVVFYSYVSDADQSAQSKSNRFFIDDVYVYDKGAATP